MKSEVNLFEKSWVVLLVGGEVGGVDVQASDWTLAFKS